MRSVNMIGRDAETKIIDTLYESKKSEFLAVYGRRRVGKTFLLREHFNYNFAFQISGLSKGNTKQQLFHFHNILDAYNTINYDAAPENWLEAFNRLKIHLELIPVERKVIFIDEMPWLDTLKSDFVIALESFWNSWATNRKDILLLATGSSASWISNKLINNAGGLHNRITAYIKLEPFNLHETELFLESKRITLTKYQIAEIYMAIGGIPYYLDYIKPGQSAIQIIENLFFEKNAPLKNEIANLYRALFKKFNYHEKIVEVLATKSKGMTRKELIDQTKLSSGGSITRVLAELEEGGFVSSYKPIKKNVKTTMYRLADFYTAFYYKFIHASKIHGKNAWLSLIDHPTHRAWQGYAFEQLSFYHIPQIKKALGIDGIHSNEASWNNDKAQIDLIIDRRDQVMNIIEIKFSLSTFTITKDYEENLRNKIAQLKEDTKTKKAIFMTMLTTFGVQQNKYAGIVNNEITLDDLFKSEN